MNIKQRLIALEAAFCHDVEDIHISRYIVYPDGIEPIGYRCDDGTKIMREDVESKEEFKYRCHDAVNWPIGETSRHTFHPIYSD